MTAPNTSDVEVGSLGSPDTGDQPSLPEQRTLLSRLRRLFRTSQRCRIEYPSGYPDFSSFMCETEYSNFRRFKWIRMRILLRKQDEISRLEDSLIKIDHEEENTLWHGAQRLDGNLERKEKFKELEVALNSYDSFLQRTTWVMGAPEPYPRHMKDMREWMRCKMCIEESEAAFLNAEITELINVGGATDRGLGKLVPFAERVAMSVYRGIKRIQMLFNPELHSSELWVSRSTNKAVARAFAGSLAVILLLVPIIVLNSVETDAWKFAVIVIAATLFIWILTAVSLAGMAEVFVAGATYAAVLVVFVSQNGPNKPQ